MELGHNHGPLSLLYFFKLGGEYKGDVLTILMPFCIPEIFQNLIKKKRQDGWGQNEEHYNLHVKSVSIVTK